MQGMGVNMKTLVFMLGLFLMQGTVYAHSIDLDALAHIESSGNPSAYNKRSQACGLYQITPIVLKQYNAVKGTSLKTRDLFDPKINKTVAEYYLGWLDRLCETDEEILIAYNWGIGNLRRWQDKGARFEKLPKETRDYILKYRRLTKLE